MKAGRACVVMVVLIAACNGEKSQNVRDDAPATPIDAAPSVGTSVTGTLGGSQFTLRYAAVQRGPTPADPIWVCVSNVMLPYSECAGSMGPDRTLFLGPFIEDETGARWGIPQVWLYRVGANALSQPANNGTLTVLKNDSSTGALELTISVNFGETPVTTGTINVGG